MQLRATTSVTRIPGNPKASERTAKEWVCPDCDYFEEAEEETSR
jgi:molybdopterin biosynthesis enzyme MoaB